MSAALTGIHGTLANTQDKLRACVKGESGSENVEATAGDESDNRIGTIVGKVRRTCCLLIGWKKAGNPRLPFSEKKKVRDILTDETFAHVLP